MFSRVYIETSVISYLTALPSRDIVQAAHQEITREWWSKRERFELYVSQVVLSEAGRGDPSAAARRLESMAGIPVLGESDDAELLAARLVEACAIPAKAAVDALHIANAVTNGMDYLLTWNCTHIANASMQKTIRQVCEDAGLQPVTICTPQELME